MISGRTLTAVALLLCLQCPTAAEDAARAPRSLDAFQHFSFAYAANHFDQKGWFGSPTGNAERIAIHLEDPESGILIELPPGVKPDAEQQVTSVLSEQGWEPGAPANVPAGNGPIFSYSPKSMARITGWNRGELRLDLDRLVAALRKLGGRPVFLCVRTDEKLDFRTTPTPRAAGLFHGNRYGFYRLREKDNGLLVVRYGVPGAALWLVALSAGLWLCVPLGWAAWVGRGGEVGGRVARVGSATTFLPLITAAGAYGTLYVQTEVLRLIRLPAAIPPPYDRLGSWVLPYCVILFLWAAWLSRRIAANHA